MRDNEELLHLEAGGACTSCDIRDRRFLTIHHIDQVEPRNEAYDNKLLLCHNCHHAHHGGKGLSLEDLKSVKRRLIISTLTQPGLNALKEANRRSLVMALPFMVNHLVEMGYLRLHGEGQTWSDGDQTGVVEGEYAITDVGRALLGKWKLT